MSGRVIVLRQPAVSPKAQVVGWRLASMEIWRLQETCAALVRMRVAFARMVATTPHPPWMPEDAVKARRPRNLLEDNPASG